MYKYDQGVYPVGMFSDEENGDCDGEGRSGLESSILTSRISNEKYEN